MTNGPIQNNYAYITLLTNDNYLPGIIILNESLKSVNSKYPLKCIVTDYVSEQVITELNSYNIETIKVNTIYFPDKIAEFNKQIDQKFAETWKHCLAKLYCFTFTNYDKVIFLDADLLILKNVDHCFEMPHMTAALDGEYSNIWPKWPHFNAGFMVIKPNKAEFNNILKFIGKINPEEITYNFTDKHYVIADQEILNLYYSNWANETDKHLNKYYNIFAPHLNTICTTDVYENAYFIHFIGWKPWNMPDIEYSGQLTTKLNLFFYIYALAFYDIFMENHSLTIDWSDLITNGAFYERMCAIALDVFFEPEIAAQILGYIPKTYTNYQKIVQTIENNRLLKQLQPILFTLVEASRQQIFAGVKDPEQLSDLNYLMFLDEIRNLKPLAARSLLADLWHAVHQAIKKYLQTASDMS